MMSFAFGNSYKYGTRYLLTKALSSSDTWEEKHIFEKTIGVGTEMFWTKRESSERETGFVDT